MVKERQNWNVCRLLLQPINNNNSDHNVDSTMAGEFQNQCSVVADSHTWQFLHSPCSSLQICWNHHCFVSGVSWIWYSNELGCSKGAWCSSLDTLQSWELPLPWKTLLTYKYKLLSAIIFITGDHINTKGFLWIQLLTSLRCLAGWHDF